MGKIKTEEKVKRVKVKVFTRAQAEKALSSGADPTQFVKHDNYHVRRKVWKLMGSPLPEKKDEQNKFLASLQGTELPKDPTAVAGFYQLVRQRILKEVPVKENV